MNAELKREIDRSMVALARGEKPSTPPLKIEDEDNVECGPGTEVRFPVAPQKM